MYEFVFEFKKSFDGGVFAAYRGKYARSKDLRERVIDTLDVMVWRMQRMRETVPTANYYAISFPFIDVMFRVVLTLD